MKRTAGVIILTALIVSVVLPSALELGHDLLHSISNPFHNHRVRHNAGISHVLKDHHFKKMRFAYQMEEPAGPPNLMALLFGLSPAPNSILVIRVSISTSTTQPFIPGCARLAAPPPTPPPLFS
ncbi:MAG TPA: hypothetical protein VG737_05090 [Cyclobacteriaceae bacterium]|nr:hypothetical protein [Cyclobacteriaceae bacterium]